MKHFHHKGFLVVHNEVVVFSDTFDRIYDAMIRFNLQSAIPFEPTYHSQFALFENNSIQYYDAKKKELSHLCIVIRLDVPLTDSVDSSLFIQRYTEQLGLTSRHALVCNAVIYS